MIDALVIGVAETFWKMGIVASLNWTRFIMFDNGSTDGSYEVAHNYAKNDSRVKIIRSLRMNDFDVLIGINLLREGLDLPEVSMIGVLDAD